MPIYIYRAVDSQGKVVKGELEAQGEIDVSNQLAKIGYLPVGIGLKYKRRVAGKLGEALEKGRKVNTHSLIIFTREFATIIRAAVPIVEGLGVLLEQTEDSVLKEVLEQVLHDVEGGNSLSSSMAKHPRAFSELYVNTIVAGEAAGVLDKVLIRLSEMLERDQEMIINIKAALRYPIMAIVALCAAVIILSIFVIPNFAQIYANMGVKLPISTRVMIFLSDMFRLYWHIISPGFILIGFIFRWVIKTKKGRLLWDGLKFKFIILGKVYSKITMLRFSNMLNVLYQAGLPVLKTMDIIALTIGNAVLAREIEHIKADVADGKGISGAVLNSRFFPRLVGYMISVGERSGALPKMLESLSEYFDLEVKTAIKNLTSLIEPIMTVVIGLVVMGMAFSIFLPLWGMLKVIKAGM